jgi:mannose-6-phosphate isomerase-like protein (cupin superfamily)
MWKLILGAGSLFVLLPAGTFSQSGAPPKDAINITAAEIKAVQQDEIRQHRQTVDEAIKIVDMGKYNLSVSVVRRLPLKPGEQASSVIHFQTAETYIVTSGAGTLVTGGKLIDPKPSPSDSDGVKILNGPSAQGIATGTTSRKVSVGDVIIIPPGVSHTWVDIVDHIDYLTVRPDPNHVLPAGYINPVLKK